MKKILRKVLLGAISLLFLFSFSNAIEKKSPTAIKTDKAPPAIEGLPGFAELTASLTLTKTLTPTGMVIDGVQVFTGTVNLNGQVCNIGTAEYRSPPLAPVQATLGGYDPTKPLTGDNYKIITSRATNYLPKGSCSGVSGTYRIEPLIFEWGHRTANHSYEIPAELEFSLNIGRNVPDDITFRAREDRDKTNNIAKERIRFMAWENTMWQTDQ